MGYTGGAALGGLLGLPPLDVELAVLQADEIDRSTPYIFLQLDEIPGDATTKGHEGEIACLACHWSLGGEADQVHNQPPRRGRAKDPHRGHVTVLKAIDKASPALSDAGATGTTLRSGTITLLRSTGGGQMGVPYLKIEMEALQVVSFESAQYGDQSFERCVLGVGDEDHLNVKYLER